MEVVPRYTLGCSELTWVNKKTSGHNFSYVKLNFNMGLFSYIFLPLNMATFA